VRNTVEVYCGCHTFSFGSFVAVVRKGQGGETRRIDLSSRGGRLHVTDQRCSDYCQNISH
jgi:hypothetical protein